MSTRATTPAAKLRRAIDVVLHDLNMSRKHALIAFGAFIALNFTVTLMFARLFALSNWGLMWRYNLARIETLLGFGGIQMLSIRGLLPAQLVRNFSGTYHETFWFSLPIAMIIGTVASVYLGLMLYVWLDRRAEELSTAKHLRGAKLATIPELMMEIDQSREGPGSYVINSLSLSTDEPKPPPLALYIEAAHLAARTYNTLVQIALRKPRGTAVQQLRKKISIPAGMVQRNFVYTGGMGSGKSQGMDALMDQVIEAGKCIVIYDKTTIATQLRYRPAKDVILNPFDTRFCANYGGGYTIFNDFKSILDFDAFSKYIIPENKKSSGGDTSDYFNDMARTVLKEIMRKCWETGHRTNAAVMERINTWSQDRLYQWLLGTEAEKILNPEAAGTGGGGVLTSLQKFCGALNYLPDGGFSLKDWLTAGMINGRDQILFLPSPQARHQVLQPYNRFILALIENLAMTYDEVSYDRLWVFLDEIYSLGKFPELTEACTEGRKYGIVHVVGLQDFAQIQDMFGDKLSRAILGNLQNQILLRVTDATTQEEYSKAIGSGEYDEQTEGLSFGAADSKDGHSVNTARQEKRAVMPAELGRLADLEGFLKITGNYPICRIKYEYIARPVVHPGYIERPDLALDLTPITPVEEDDDTPAPAQARALTQQASDQPASSTGEASDKQGDEHNTPVIDHELQDGIPTTRTPGRRKIGQIGLSSR